MSYTVVCALVYLFLVALVFAPQCPKAEGAADPETPVDYFPEPTPEVKPAPKPAPIKGWDTVETAPETTPTPPVLEVTEPAEDLASLGIRQLKKLASAAKIKGYSKLTKAELILALS